MPEPEVKKAVGQKRGKERNREDGEKTGLMLISPEKEDVRPSSML